MKGNCVRTVTSLIDKIACEKNHSKYMYQNNSHYINCTQH